MKEQDALKIIQQEQLSRINWYDDHYMKENEVGIKKDHDVWVVYITGERAEIITGTENEYPTDEDAYKALIQKARYLKKVYG